MRERNTKSSAGVGRIIADDIRRGDIRKNVKRDLRDMYEFYLDDDERARLAGMGRLRRWISMVIWLVKSLLVNLTPVRRLLLVLSLLLVMINRISFDRNGTTFGIDLTAVGFVILLVVLMLELKDKLLAKDELETGRAVQLALLPRDHPQVPGWDIWMFTRPANEVGGDLVDHLDTGGDRKGLVLGDVAGKGLGAALLMAKLQATVRALAPETGSLTELGGRLNAIFHRDRVGDRYATLLYLEVAPGANELHLLNAGHPPPVVLRPNGAEELPPVSTALGVLPDSAFVEQTVALGPGDLMVAYSDGVTEAQNEAGEFFGEERLQDLLPSLRPLPVGDAGRRLRSEVERFAGERPLGDDLSLILLRRRD